jgi:hypothetical protein
MMYRVEDLFLGQSGNKEDLRIFCKRPHTRKDFMLLTGSEIVAQQEWNAAKTFDRLDISGKDFASCVRGHFLHSHCFQSALISGKGCPSCSEPLWVPMVERQRPADDEVACAARAHGGDGLLDALSRVEVVEAAAARNFSEAGRGAAIRGHELRMCPICCSSPLYNEDCADLKRHHGECPQCRDRIPNANSTIAEALSKVGGGVTVADITPKCARCKIPVVFNGCQSCGHLFAGDGNNEWSKLPLWDPNAAKVLDLDQNARIAARMLAAQVRDEVVRLAHERQSLAEALAEEKGEKLVTFSAAKPPPPPAYKRK